MGALSPTPVDPPAFNVRFTPSFESVGQAGWNVVVEQNGAFGGSMGIGVIHPSTPFVGVYGSSKGGSHIWTTVAVTLPEVTAVSVEGSTTVPTEALPGLPYGLRVARVVTPYEEPPGDSLLSGTLVNRVPGIKPMVALGANGETIPQANSPETQETPSQGTVHSWSDPSAPAQGSCELRSSATGLTAESGAVLSNIRPYPGQIFGNAFLLCNSSTYSLQGQQLRVYVLLDAAHPGNPPAVIPGMAPVPGEPGIYGGSSGYYGGPTDLTAERSGVAWVAVEGADPTERMQLLEDLSAKIEP